MKQTKRFLAILLAALLLVGALSTAALAADAMTDFGAVKIVNALAGANYKFYRVLDISGVAPDGKAAFITNQRWNEAIRNFGMGFATFESSDIGAAVTITGFNAPANAQAFAERVAAAAENGSISPDADESVRTSGEFAVTSLQYGFYVMVSSRLAADATPQYTVFTINSGNPVEIQEKNEEFPSISKKVNGEDAIDADFNTVLNYSITIRAAAGTDKYTIEDTLPAQIEFVTDSLQIRKPDGTVLVEGEGANYTLTTDQGKFTIELSDELRNSLADGDEILITYQGKLQPNTSTLTAYTNAAKLTYGENGEKSASNDAKVFSGHIGFDKKDNKGNFLADAKFQLKNADGKFAKLDGSGISYSFVEWVDDETDATTITTTAAAATITIRGVKSGAYTLIETEAPTGYIKGEDTTVTVTRLNTPEGILNGLENTAKTVVNTLGADLPETGGIGTTIFYVAGGLLVLCALALIVFRRRKV